MDAGIDNAQTGVFLVRMNRAGLAQMIAALLLGHGSNGAISAAMPDGPGFASKVIQLPGGPAKAGFTSMSPRDTGVGFTNLLQGDANLTNLVAHNGSGLAIGDVDGDGRVDLYFSCLQGPNRLYRNLGNWRFEEVPLNDAACADQFSTGTALDDVDGDGDLDLLVNGIAAGTRLFLNDGTGGFTEMRESGLSRTASATSLALADIDGDGDLDLYCPHYIDVMHLADPTTRFAVMLRGGRWVVIKVNGQPADVPPWKDRFEVLPGGRIRELPEVDGLYRNEGRGRFKAIQFEPGVFLDEQGAPRQPSRDWGLSAMFRDFNGDGAPDLYVCNDNASPDRMWINSGQGTFRAAASSLFRHSSRSSMGLDIADVNRDGLDDLFILDMLAREHGKRVTQLVRDRPDLAERDQAHAQPRFNRNMLFLARPDGSYAETALMAGIAATDWSWCPIFLDVDLDGYEDLLVSNGFTFDVMDQDSNDQIKGRRMTRDEAKRSRKLHPFWPTPNAAFRNRGDAIFEPAGHVWGFDHTGVSNGMALGDFDNDGDMDVAINALNRQAILLRNDSTAPRIAVRLRGLPPNTEAIGARIQVSGGAVTQSQDMIRGGRYMSSDQVMRVFAAVPGGQATAAAMRIDVRWPNGDRTVLENVQPNRIYEIDQSKAVSDGAAPSLTQPEPAPFFADVSPRLGHVHSASPFDDWARQPSLPRRLSTLGPGVSWFDVNEDGWEDLLIPIDDRGRIAFYMNQHGEKFQRSDRAAPDPVLQKAGAVAGWTDGHGNRSVLAALSCVSPGARKASALATFPTGNAAPQPTAAGPASLGPLALADIDGDGDLDLFIGGRFHPGRYPEPVSSAVWLNERGKLVPNQALSRPFADVGLVSGATFADLDGDGRPDLALAVEWSPIRIFRNVNGQFSELTADLGLNAMPGWWTSVAAGDFNGDGKMDLAAGNWGRNSIYELHRPAALGLFYGEWRTQGIVDVLEAWQDGPEWRPLRDRHAAALALPDVAIRFSTHQAYGQATVRDLLQGRYSQAGLARASHLESTVFLNCGSRFEPVPLPREAQVAPVFSLNVGDFDGDGIEDLFLGQNFLGSASDLSRDDSGLGLWLRGKGDGTFSAVDSVLSGVRLEGEQRGAALCDFNHDGRVDFAVAQHNGPARLFLNQRARRGLRVTLRGTAANPDGIGALLRVVPADGRAGPCRVIVAGSGYWSQDAAVQILGLPPAPAALWIRWPDGKEQAVRLKEGKWDLEIEHKP